MRGYTMASLNEPRSQSPAKAVKPSVVPSRYAFAVSSSALGRGPVGQCEVCFAPVWMGVEWLASVENGAVPSDSVMRGAVRQCAVRFGPSGRLGLVWSGGHRLAAVLLGRFGCIQVRRGADHLGIGSARNARLRYGPKGR